MIPQGLFTQIAMIILAVGIVFTYVKPKYTEVAANQDVVSQYREEQQKVAAVNATLDELLAKADAINEVDERRLMTYIPNEVDVVAVQRDILYMVEQVGITPTELTYGALTTATPGRRGSQAETATVIEGRRSFLTPHAFSLTFTTDYVTLKKLLAVVERNQYPLEVTNLSIGGDVTDGGDDSDVVVDPNALAISLTLTTYQFSMNEEDDEEALES